MKRWIAAVVLAVLLMSAVSVSADGLGIGVVKGGWLRMRSAPTTLSAVIGRYYTSTQVTVHSATGAWYYVTAPDGNTGYMSRNYITLGSGGGSSVPPPGGWSGVPSGETGYVTSQNGRGVRLRSSPSAISSVNVIGLYSVGTRLTVLQRGVGWHYIQIGGQVGYMMSQFIVISGGHGPTPPPTPDVHYTAYVTSQNGKGVRLRSGPGTSYSMLGTYPVGTQVTVLKDLGAWSYISIGSKKGYMMSVFLTTTPPGPPIPIPTYVPPVDPVGTIASAQITIQNPIIGDRLYVYVTPDNADYNVLWYHDNGTLLGSGNGYPVKNSDRGHRIRARVTGRNGWAGVVDTLYTDVIGGSGTPTPTPAPHATLTGMVALPTDVHVTDTLTPMLFHCNASTLIYTWYVDSIQYAVQPTLYVTAAMAGKTIQVIATATGYQGSLTAVTTVQAAPTPTPTDSIVELITPPPFVPHSVPEVEPVTPEVEPITPIVEPIIPVVEPVTPEVEPVTPVVEPVIPEVEPITPVVEPVTPVVEPITPVVEPVTPVVEPITPVVEPVTPVVEPITPVVEPITPVVEPVTPVVEPVAPVVEPVTPVVEPVAPVVEPITPVVEPVTPVTETTEPEPPPVELIVP